MLSQTNSPLRYPGGKSVFANFFSAYIQANDISDPIYIEPYCGGSGAAINLLLSNHVSEIWLNDASFSIFSFWQSIRYYGEEFIEKLDQTPVTLEEWSRQKNILESKKGKSQEKSDILANGFATFFLNRCNRSGILNAGPIGGKRVCSQLAANYKIDARFNKLALKNKLIAIIERKDQIRVSNDDASTFLTSLGEEELDLQKRCLVYLDPPYYRQGSSLYLNFYKHDDHLDIANLLSKIHEWKWLLSYDNVPEIREMYKSFPQYSFYINYSAQESKLGNELLIHSSNSTLPESRIIKKMRNNKRIELESLSA